MAAAPPVAAPSAAAADAVKPLHLYSAGFSTHPADSKKKGNARHVLIPNFVAVAKALKKELPALSSPCGLFAVFDGEPMASEHCAKNMHVQLLQHLTKLSGKVSEMELKRAIRSSMTALDLEVQERLPAQAGCCAAVAFVSGPRVFIVQSGLSSVATCEGPRVASGADGSPGEKDNASSNPVQLLGRVKRNLGAGENLTQKLGATGPAVWMTRQSSIQASGSRPGSNAANTLSVEDVKVIYVKEGQHDCLILGSSSLLRGTTLPEMKEAVSTGTPGDALTVSTAVAMKAKSRQVQKTTDKACWVQNENEKNEITCAAILFHFGEELDKAAAQQPEKKQKVGAVAVGTTSLAEAYEKSRLARWEVRDNADFQAIGPVMQDGTEAVHIKEEAKVFDILELDGTAQNRMAQYGTAHHRGGTNKRPRDDEDGKGGKGKGGKGKGKGKGKKGKGKGKGKGKRKGKKGKGSDDEGEEGGDDDDEGDYGEDDDGDITGDEGGYGEEDDGDDGGGIEIAAEEGGEGGQ